MGKHPLHEAIGRLFDESVLPGFQVSKDAACWPEQRHRVTLSLRSRAGNTRLCDVDLLAHKPGGRTVIIEVEESNVKPVQVFGKFFASAHATHHGEARIDEHPLLFIQVLDTSALKMDKTGKTGQWKVLEALVKRHAKGWPGRDVKYEVLEGGPDDFKPGSSRADRLVGLVRDFLGVKA